MDTTLHLLCGKMASGKSTLAISLAKNNNAILIIEDEWLRKLYPDEVHTIDDYQKYSTRIKNIISLHVTELLNKGISVVLDFPGNTINQRKWLRSLFEGCDCLHILHYVEASNETCKRQLKKRNETYPDQTAFTSDEEFDMINKYFQPPSEDEGLKIIRH